MQKQLLHALRIVVYELLMWCGTNKNLWNWKKVSFKMQHVNCNYNNHCTQSEPLQRHYVRATNVWWLKLGYISGFWIHRYVQLLMQTKLTKIKSNPNGRTDKQRKGWRQQTLPEVPSLQAATSRVPKRTWRNQSAPHALAPHTAYQCQHLQQRHKQCQCSGHIKIK